MIILWNICERYWEGTVERFERGQSEVNLTKFKVYYSLKISKTKMVTPFSFIN